ncbi:MAG TPA: hypothetical protein VF538_02950 [Pyrinomonadaceae bacterium]|jgi:hypothetical protein
MSGTYEVGWTPKAVESVDARPLFQNLDQYKRGRGNIRPLIVGADFQPWGVNIKIQVGFRIDEWWAKLGNPFLFGGKVPNMQMTIDLEVYSGGNHRVLFNGSYIPTQLYQVDSRPAKTYHMINDMSDYIEVQRAAGAGSLFGSVFWAPQREVDPKFRCDIP